MLAASEDSASLPQYDYQQQPAHGSQYPSLLVGRLETMWQPGTMPTVLATQPSNCYMVDPHAVPFPQAPPMPMLNSFAPDPTYPCMMPPPPPPPPQAGFAVVQIFPAESAVRPPTATPKQQLLLDQFLQPRGEVPEARPRNASDAGRKHAEPASSGDVKSPEPSASQRPAITKKVLVPGLVADGGSSSSQEGGNSVPYEEPSPKHAPSREAEGSMDAQKVASLFSEDKTTVMLRNIPNRYTCEELLSEVIMAGFDRMFDFFYLPMDFKTKRNRGYGFINFHSSAAAKQFALAFHHRQLKLYASKKIMEVAPAVTQGYQANLSKYFEKDSDRIKNDWFRPMLFTHEAFELD